MFVDQEDFILEKLGSLVKNEQDSEIAAKVYEQLKDNADINEETIKQAFQQLNKEELGMDRIDLYNAGAEDAIEKLASLYEQGADFEDLLSVVVDSLESFNKTASLEEQLVDNGIDHVCREFIKQASELSAAHDCDLSQFDQYKVAEAVLSDVIDELNGEGSFYEDVDPDYWLGKQAALDQLCDLANDGADFYELYDEANYIINEDLDKTASVEDVDFALGFESICHDFVKIATQMDALYDLDEYEDYALVEHALTKIAKQEKKKSKAQKAKEKARELKNRMLDAAGDYGDMAARAGRGALRGARAFVDHAPGVTRRGMQIATGLGASPSPIGALKATPLGMAYDGARLAGKGVGKAVDYYKKRASYQPSDEDVYYAQAILEEAGYDFDE